LALQTLRRKVWLSWDLRAVREAEQSVSDRDLASLLGRTQKAVAAKRRRMGIVKSGSPRKQRPALVEDIHTRADDCGMAINAIERAIDAPGGLRPSRQPSKQSVPLVAVAAVELLGGELFAVWDD
jgi:hypothetical protein